MPQDLTGTCVLTTWEDGTEYHSDDPTTAEVDWRKIEAEARQVMELYGRHREVCGAFVQNGVAGVATVVLENVSEQDGQFMLGRRDTIWLYEQMEAGLLQGLWHTHPNGRRTPSEADWSGLPHGVPMYIISIESSTGMLVVRFDESDRPRPRHSYASD